MLIWLKSVSVPHSQLCKGRNQVNEPGVVVANVCNLRMLGVGDKIRSQGHPWLYNNVEVSLGYTRPWSQILKPKPHKSEARQKKSLLPEPTKGYSISESIPSLQSYIIQLQKRSAQLCSERHCHNFRIDAYDASFFTPNQQTDVKEKLTRRQEWHTFFLAQKEWKRF